MIARVEAGSSERRVRDLRRVARWRATCSSSTSRWPRRRASRCKLESAGPVMVRANRELISQALANLVDNAIKYADEGSERAARS